MKIAVLENGIVENIIECESIELASQLIGKECVAFTDNNPIALEIGLVEVPQDLPINNDTI